MQLAKDRIHLQRHLPGTAPVLRWCCRNRTGGRRLPSSPSAPSARWRCSGGGGISQTARGLPASRGSYPTFLLFLLLENRVWSLPAMLLGMLLGIPVSPAGERFQFLWVRNHTYTTWTAEVGTCFWCVLGGARGVGAVFDILYDVRPSKRNAWYGLALGAGLAAAGIYLLPSVMTVDQPRIMFATLMLLGLPLFYVLTLASMTEESEVEITREPSAPQLRRQPVVPCEYFMPGNLVSYANHRSDCAAGRSTSVLRVRDAAGAARLQTCPARHQLCQRSARCARPCSPWAGPCSSIHVTRWHANMLWNVHRRMDFTTSRSCRIRQMRWRCSISSCAWNEWHPCS